MSARTTSVGATMSSLLQRPLRRFRKGSLIRSVMVLACGTAGAQALTILVTPILTRIFSPETYGLMGLLMSAAGLLVVVNTLRFDKAIPLEQDDDEASRVVSLALVSSVVVSLLVMAGGAAFSLVRGEPGVLDGYDLIPLAAVLSLAMALRLTSCMWAVHRERYARIATSEVFQAFASLSLQLVGGLLGLGALALLGGQMVGTTLAALAIAIWAWRDGAMRALFRADGGATWRLARKHFRFPAYSVPTALLDRFSKHLPVFILAMFFSPLQSGFYWLCHRVMVNPGRMIVQNMRKPYYKRAADLQARGEPIGPLLLKGTLLLAMVAVPLATVVAIYGPELFRLLFGPEWGRAGEYAQWLVFRTAVAMLAIPCIELAPVLQRQGHLLGLQIVDASARAGALFTGALLGDDLLAIQLYSIVSIAMSLLVIGYFWVTANTAPKVARTGAAV